MANLRRAGIYGALLMISVLLVAASGRAATTTPSPRATPVGEATPAPAAEGTAGLALPTFDLGALTGGMPGVDSYRTSFSIGGELAYESVVVTKPVLSKDIQT